MFCRAMFASVSKMLGMGGGCDTGLLPAPREAIKLGGGLPGGVVDSFCCLGALSFSLNELTMEVGKVWPFSQMSTSFLIFSYKTIHV